jgi:hypothetical protein
MDEQKFCQGCDQEHNCEKLYKKLGDVQGPSIVFEAIIAFVLPIVVFVASLIVFDKILAGAVGSKHMQIAISCLLALLVTSVLMLGIKLIK